MPFFITANAVYYKHILEKVGLFNENLYSGGDVDLSWRIQLQTGKSLTYNPKAIIYHAHRTNLIDAFRLYKKWGYGRTLLIPRYMNNRLFKNSFTDEIKIFLKQIYGLMFWFLCFFYRLVTWKIKHRSKMDVISPIFYIITESGDITGKIQGTLHLFFKGKKGKQ